MKAVRMFWHLWNPTVFVEGFFHMFSFILYFYGLGCPPEWTFEDLSEKKKLFEVFRKWLRLYSHSSKAFFNQGLIKVDAFIFCWNFLLFDKFWSGFNKTSISTLWSLKTLNALNASLRLRLKKSGKRRTHHSNTFEDIWMCVCVCELILLLLHKRRNPTKVKTWNYTQIKNIQRFRSANISPNSS